MYKRSYYRGSRRRREKERTKKIFEEIIAEKLLNIGKEIVSQVQRTERPRQDKPKEEHTKTYCNQTDKN